MTIKERPRQFGKLEAAQTTLLLLCALEQIKYIYIYLKEAFKLGPSNYNKSARKRKDLLGIAQSSSPLSHSCLSLKTPWDDSWFVK